MSSSQASASTDDLRQKLSTLRAEKLLLTSQLTSLRSLPSTQPSPLTPLQTQNEELGRALRSLEEKSILYRSSAWTCFELDLDVGRRARSSRDPSSASKDGDLALGIRLDTFWRAKFHEPYYLVFARPSQLLETAQLSGTTSGDVNVGGNLADGLRLIRHTIPHFIPLGKLVEKYLPSVVGGEVSGGAGSRGRDNEAGGLTLLSQFQELPGIQAFLSDLHCHLQAYVSRRGQAMALQHVELPGKKEQHGAALEALGTEAFDLVKVIWQIPSVANAEEQAEEAEGTDADPSNPTAAALKSAAKRKREHPDDLPSQHLELIVQYDDLQSDRLVDATRPTGLFHSPPPDPSSTEVPSAIEGTRKDYGAVQVQLLLYAPEQDTRQRRAPGISKADLKALRPEVERRQDLEMIYSEVVDGECLDMDEAFAKVARKVWAQLGRGKNNVR
ncbi:uncharacterized protein MEPE_04524 [Melanopsichium pennsylvanicum]|uniref:Uncharacterized protein n=2 Tax=Melanopsichium pennsylvanicum TaxID=63383 RepID=A0AAJ5C6G1_9BASI|nr:protein of centromere protein cenp-o family [Melanopsichium pennsylvanicum 4]SNX85815.1 uncharacterized protein MEPE_04524 [Melanopsichium pennsylvanicum]